MNILCVIDMQHDFLYGSLANKKADVVIENVIQVLNKKKWDSVIFTQDEHDSNYPQTREGKMLPVKHCITGTPGFPLHSNLLDWIMQNANQATIANKPHISILFKNRFFCDTLIDEIKLAQRSNFSPAEPINVFFCGVCTDICVISNALQCVNIPNWDVAVYENACAGLTEEYHNMAIQVMKNCQVKMENV